MIWRIVRSRGFIPLVLIFAALLYWKYHSASSKAVSVGYIADREVILWNTLAQVREPVGDMHYGDRVEVLRVEGTATQVRTASGTIGWVPDSRQIMDSELWGKSASLLDRVRALPVQGRGRMKAVSNVRVESGRDAKRIFQFVRGTPVLIFQRAVAEPPQTPEENAQQEKTSSAGGTIPKQEDWLLVMRAPDSTAPDNGLLTAEKGPGSRPSTLDSVGSGPLAGQSASTAGSGPAGLVAGWVLARFVQLDLPGPIKDYASSADLHIVAWFELNRVPDGSGGEAPQYLVAASRGAGGQACDFTMLRVYTWGKVHKRYETAYVESNLCGHLPIRVSTSPKGPEFHFADFRGGAVTDRKYIMQTTTVRRLMDESSPRSRRN